MTTQNTAVEACSETTQTVVLGIVFLALLSVWASFSMIAMDVIRMSLIGERSLGTAILPAAFIVGPMIVIALALLAGRRQRRSAGN